MQVHNVCMYITVEPHNIHVIDEPDSYLPCSILMLLCCCPLFGFVALIFSFKVSNKRNCYKGSHKILIMIANKYYCTK